jgi:hypothetical protein
MALDEQFPGDPALLSGEFEEVNIFGSRTGRVVLAMKGDELPPAPRGFGWRLLAARGVVGLRAQSAGYRRMAATATTTAVMQALYMLADRYDALADQRERDERSRGTATC